MARKTIDVWYIFVNYGYGMPTKPADAECTELGRWQFMVNKLAYELNWQYPISTRKGRMPIADLPGGWNEASNKIAEAKAEIDYRQTMIRLYGSTTIREQRLQLAENKLARLGEAPASLV